MDKKTEKITSSHTTLSKLHIGPGMVYIIFSLDLSICTGLSLFSSQFSPPWNTKPQDERGATTSIK